MRIVHDVVPRHRRQRAAGHAIGRLVVVIAEPDAADEIAGVAHEPGVAISVGRAGLASSGSVLLVMMLLSGSTTPLESMPVWLQYLMKIISPTPHFVIFAQDVLYRGADFSIVWPEILAMTIIGAVYFGFALYRFRRVIFGSSG